MSGTTVLITGANRGIGKGLLSTYLSRPNYVVIAGVRDPNSTSSKALLDLPQGSNSKVIVVKIDSNSETDAGDAVKSLKSSGITKLDIVIANAGIANFYGPAVSTPINEVVEHFNVNVLGPLRLFQATAELLEAAPKPKFIPISSVMGSIAFQENIPIGTSAYGASKAALNFVTRKIHYENPKFVSLPIHPGWLQTELGNAAATGVGLEAAPTSVEDGVAGVIKQVDNATRESTFVGFDGATIPW